MSVSHSASGTACRPEVLPLSKKLGAMPASMGGPMPPSLWQALHLVRKNFSPREAPAAAPARPPPGVEQPTATTTAHNTPLRATKRGDALRTTGTSTKSLAKVAASYFEWARFRNDREQPSICEPPKRPKPTIRRWVSRRTSAPCSDEVCTGSDFFDGFRPSWG